jgi:hypothetical protein
MALLPIIPVSMSGQIDHTVEVILRRERSGRPLCANSGHCPTKGEPWCNLDYRSQPQQT